LGSADMETVINVNTLGVKRVCDAFIPLLEPAGRVVNVSSASGPKFVSQCSPQRQAFFQDASVEWKELEQLINDACGDAQRYKALGLGEANPYGFSKACASLFTLLLARDNPALCINACTPGYIETDLTRPLAEKQGASPSDMGMKSPEHGTVSTLFLLFGQPQGSGHYYGSDARRSPLDCYRAPGSPEYTGGQADRP
jgi:carbonyl reductase 1